MANIPGRILRTLLAHRGPSAAEWVRGLPAALDSYAARWSLTLGAPCEPLSFNYVMRVTGPDGEPLILKLSMPEGDPDFDGEAEALQLAEGHGMVALRQMDRTPALVALLLEAVLPGVPLTSVEDDAAATSAAVGVMRRMWRPALASARLPTLADWARGFARHRARFGGSGPILTPLFERGEALYRELAAIQAPSVLLHGDLHHDNILSATREPWLAIDPKGLLGEPAYEVGALLRNPRERLAALPDAAPLFARRLDQLADELAMDRARLHGWGLSQLVLSAVWTLEDAEDLSEASFALGCAEAMARVKR